MGLLGVEICRNCDGFCDIIFVKYSILWKEENMASDHDLFNCSEEYEIDYVAGLYKDKSNKTVI